MATENVIPEFLTAQEEMKNKRAALLAASSALVQAQYQIQQKQKLQTSLLNSGLTEESQEVMDADADRANAVNQTLEIAGHISTLDSALNTSSVEFGTLADPRLLVSQLDDQMPVLLLPMRVEIRFMTIQHIARTNLENPNLVSVPDKKELWVRLFPDDIAIHTHEPELTDDELRAGTTYWAEIAQEAESPTTGLGPWRVLAATYGSQRAAWIAKITKPVQGPPPIIPMRPSSWTRAPHTRVLPDQFVVRLFSGGNYREVVGKTVPEFLQMSIDPQEDDENYKRENGDLELPDSLKWMTDFEEAVEVGMGIRVELDGNEADLGFDKIFVLGVKASADAAESKEILETLIDNHHYTSGGFGIVKQGSPTNNTEDVKTNFTAFGMDQEESWRIETGDPLFSVETADKDKTDGQHLAEALGISYEKLEHIENADGTDVSEGMAMNRAIWPATMGYFLDQMMFPVFDDSQIADVRDYFGQFVLGRGRIPSIRVANQPYGIIPTTAFSRWSYPGTDNRSEFLRALHDGILSKVEVRWRALTANVSNVSNPGNDPKETFLNILGLHASSVEFYQRFSAGLFLMWNLHNFTQQGTSTPTDLSAFLNKKDFVQQFGNDGYDVSIIPRIFEFVFMQDQKYLNGPVIDNLRPSETRPVRNFTQTNENYLNWLNISNLQQVMSEDFSNLTIVQQGGEGQGTELPSFRPPQALLYLLLRQSCLLEWIRSGMLILQQSNQIDPTARLDLEMNGIEEGTQPSGEVQRLIQKQVTAEVTLVNLQQIELEVERQSDPDTSESARTALRQQLIEQSQPEVESTIESTYQARINAYVTYESKFDFLQETFEDITSEGQTLEEFMEAELQVGSLSVAGLVEVKEALAMLQNIPTARLERCLAETLDVCNYRLDAWFTGLVADRLHSQRLQATSRTGGLYLGAYGILENARPGSFPGIHIQEVVIESDNPGESAPTHNSEIPEHVYLGDGEGVQISYDFGNDRFMGMARVDVNNQGYIHAPSVNQAIAAAVLRAGYQAHQDQDGSPDDALAVNLTSDRVRIAISYLEGIRGGQELGALLGYRFERAVHDAGLDGYIHEIRMAFPLVAGRVLGNSNSSDIRNFEAYNVVDGLRLVEAFRAGNWILLVWGENFIFPRNDLDILTSNVQFLMEHIDAIGDLLMAEGVFQIVQGNYERATGTMNILTKGAFPQEPEIIKTQRTGQVLTQRAGVMFDTFNASDALWSAPASPRSHVEAKVNTWVAGLLPAPDKICFQVEYAQPSSTDQEEVDNLVTQKLNIGVLGLQPLDFLYLAGQMEDTGLDAELSKRIAFYTKKNLAGRDDHPVKIILMDRIDLASNTPFADNEYTIFEIMPMLRRMLKLLNASRPLDAKDFLLPSEADDILAQNIPGGYNATDLTLRFDKVIQAVNPTFNSLSEILTSLTAKTALLEAVDFQGAPPLNLATLFEDVRQALMEASNFSLTNPIPESAIDTSESAAIALIVTAKRAKSELEGKQLKVNPLLAGLASLSQKEKIAELEKISTHLFGRSFRIFPQFTFYNAAEIQNAQAYTGLLDNAGEFAMETWMPGIARVKEKMATYHHLGLLTRSIQNDDSLLKMAPMQLPWNPAGGDRWLGMQIPQGYEISGDTLSLVMDYPAAYDNTQPQAGFLIDEWHEDIPDPHVTTGLAMHFNKPNTEAPNALLLVVSPDEKGYWLWDDLMNTLDETLDWAKKRAVEPDLLDGTAFAQVLPTIMAPINAGNTTANLDFGRNIVEVNPGQIGPLTVVNSGGGAPQE